MKWRPTTAVQNTIVSNINKAVFGTMSAAASGNFTGNLTQQILTKGFKTGTYNQKGILYGGTNTSATDANYEYNTGVRSFAIANGDYYTLGFTINTATYKFATGYGNQFDPVLFSKTISTQNTWFNVRYNPVKEYNGDFNIEVVASANGNNFVDLGTQAIEFKRTTTTPSSSNVVEQFLPDQQGHFFSWGISSTLSDFHIIAESYWMDRNTYEKKSAVVSTTTDMPMVLEEYPEMDVWAKFNLDFAITASNTPILASSTIKEAIEKKWTLKTVYKIQQGSPGSWTKEFIHKHFIEIDPENLFTEAINIGLNTSNATELNLQILSYKVSFVMEYKWHYVGSSSQGFGSKNIQQVPLERIQPPAPEIAYTYDIKF